MNEAVDLIYGSACVRAAEREEENERERAYNNLVDFVCKDDGDLTLMEQALLLFDPIDGYYSTNKVTTSEKGKSFVHRHQQVKDTILAKYESES